MKKTNKLMSLLLSIIIVLGIIPFSIHAEEETVNVTVKFDASVVADNMQQLYEDLSGASIIDESVTNLPEEIALTVPKGASVKEILIKAQEENGFTATGIDEGYITQVGFVSGDILSNLVSIDVGNYSSGNIFSSAGWGFYMDGEMLSAGIADVTVSQDNAIIEGRFGLYTGWDSNWNAINYDQLFLKGYYDLKELTERSVDITSFSQEEQEAFYLQKENAITLLNHIYDSSKINNNVSSVLMESNPEFHISGGMWIGYYEEMGDSLWGENSPTEQLKTAREQLLACIDKTSPKEPEDEPEDTDTPEATIPPAGTDDPSDNLNDYDIRTRISAILENLSKSYIDETAYWEAMDMGAYEIYAPDTENKLNEETRQQIINLTINDIANIKDTDLAKVILCLTSMGVDARELYRINNNTPINLIDKLNNATHSTSAWSAPYILAAYNRGEYSSREKELNLVNALLDTQKDDGSWDEFGTIDTTANAISGLAFYMDDEDEEIKEKVNSAITSAVSYLSANQNQDGSFSDPFSGANSNSTSMVIIALCAVGIDPENSELFTKNENTVLDALLSFVLDDNSGIGFLDNDVINSYSTEQGFRALTAVMQTIKSGTPYNIYDFSSLSLESAREQGQAVPEGVTPPSPGSETIAVRVTIKTEKQYWLNSYCVIIPKDNATACDAFVKACRDNSLIQTGAERGYIQSITRGSETLSEFDGGKDSGWLYKVNGVSPMVGLMDYSIKDGDNIVVYYTNDYNLDSSSSNWRNPTNVKDKEEETSQETDEDTDKEMADDKVNIAVSFEDVPQTHWAHSHIMNLAQKNIIKGKESGFAPEDNITRAEFVTILFRMSGEELPETTDKFSDVASGDWYAQNVAWALNTGITSGVSQTLFAPQEKITRQDMAVMLKRFVEHMAISLNETAQSITFTDESEFADYSKNAVSLMHKAGIISGMDDGTFAPTDNATRAQAAKMLNMIFMIMES